ncbi:DUF3024 domain-containing protein [bacterium]|nr:DUF3024 domain-containing protein [bacterium]
MSIPQAIKKNAEQLLTQYCEDKVPLEYQNEIKIKYYLRGNSIYLIESRPSYFKPSEWLDLKVAKFQFNPDDKTWSLYWANRNERWFEYDYCEPTPELKDLLKAVENDETGVFWG